MTQAVILAGGKGTRLATVSGGLPKPLVPVAGVPVVERQIELLVRYGVDEIFLTTGYRAEMLEAHLGDGSRWGIALHHIREGKPLGTAGGVAALRDRLHDDFLVLYGDVLVHMDLARLLRFHRDTAAAATLVVHPNDHPYDSDLVDLDPQGRVRAFYPKPHPEGGPDLPNMVSAALYVLSRPALAHIEPGANQDFVRDVFPRMLAAGAALYAYHTTEYLKDMGTPERHARVDNDVKNGIVEAMHADHSRSTLFLDRDGVINREVNGVFEPEQLELLPGVGDAIRRMNKAGWLVAGVTNQPAIAKGFMSEENLTEVHLRLQGLLGKEGAWLDAMVHCPHHPERGFEGERAELKHACSCRKPGAGLLEKVASRLPVARNKAVMVGDSWRDMAAAHAFGAEAIGVVSGHGMCEPALEQYAGVGRPDVIVEDLTQAVSLLLDVDPEVEALATQICEQSPGSREGPLVLLLGGLSRAGKSTTAFRLRRALRARGEHVLWVRLDDWLLPASRRPAESTVAQRYQLPQVQAALKQLVAGHRVEAPGYDPHTRENALAATTYDPRDATVFLVEGVPALLLEPEGEVLHIYVEAQTEEQRLRRLRRFYVSKGFSGNEVTALLNTRHEEHVAVSASGERASVRFVPRGLLGARPETTVESTTP